MNKKVWLDKVYYDIGKQQYDFFVCGLKKMPDGEIKATKWKKYSEVCFPLEPWEDWKIEWVNQRQILPIEVVLDLESEEQLEPTIKILKKLNLKKLSKIFFTGSKGYHIHIFFKENISDFKEKILSYFGADIQKGSSKTMIALEFCPHWKTGKLKEEIIYGN